MERSPCIAPLGAACSLLLTKWNKAPSPEQGRQTKLLVCAAHPLFCQLDTALAWLLQCQSSAVWSWRHPHDPTCRGVVQEGCSQSKPGSPGNSLAVSPSRGRNRPSIAWNWSTCSSWSLPSSTGPQPALFGRASSDLSPTGPCAAGWLIRAQQARGRQAPLPLHRWRPQKRPGTRVRCRCCPQPLTLHPACQVGPQKHTCLLPAV